MKNPRYLSVWVWILNHVVHSDDYDVMFKGKRIRLQCGQITAGAKQIAAETGVKQTTVERILKVFVREEMIGVQPSNRCSLITVKNWNAYQNIGEQNGEQSVSKQQTSGDYKKNEEKEKMKDHSGLSNELRKKIIKHLSREECAVKQPTAYLSSIEAKASPRAIKQAWKDWENGCGVHTKGDFYERCLHWQAKYSNTKAQQ